MVYINFGGLIPLVFHYLCKTNGSKSGFKMGSGKTSVC